MITIKRIKNHLELKIAYRSSENYIRYLRKKGIAIGAGTYIQDPKNTKIDYSRPSLIQIGDNCFFNSNVSILTHDWVTHVFINTGRDFLNSSGKVTIGNNVSFGQNVMVLKGVTIGDNCFIGAGSIVTKDIPENSLAIGTPCRPIMTIEEYYSRRKMVCEEEAFEYVRSIKERFGRDPVPGDFREEFIYFVNGNEIDKYPTIPIRFQLGPVYDKYILEHKAKYANFAEFLKAAGL